MPKQSEDTRIRPVKTVISCSCVFASLWRCNEEDPCAVGYSTDCQLLIRHWTTSYSSKLCVCVDWCLGPLHTFPSCVCGLVSSLCTIGYHGGKNGIYCFLSKTTACDVFIFQYLGFSFLLGLCQCPTHALFILFGVFLILCLLFGAMIISQNFTDILWLSFYFVFLFLSFSSIHSR